jgi:hypothetical protein
MVKTPRRPVGSDRRDLIATFTSEGGQASRPFTRRIRKVSPAPKAPPTKQRPLTTPVAAPRFEGWAE